MIAELQQTVPDFVTCKVCHGRAVVFGETDFNRSAHGTVPGSSKIPIRYHRCNDCGLVFTVAMDRFSRADFSRHIYNDDYGQFDPDYSESRPAENARQLIARLGAHKTIRLLDYGAGNGEMVRKLRAAGYVNAIAYDPFDARCDQRPDGTFDIITSFEVAEHSNTPLAMFGDMKSMLADGGVIVFSTLLQPPDIDRQGTDWWYVSPRTGHVTLYSRQSLQRVARQLELNYVSAGDALHFFFTTPTSLPARIFFATNC